MNADSTKTIDSTVDMLVADEGFSARVYRCPAGYLTVGHGINLDHGITPEESEAVMRIRLSDMYARITRRTPLFLALSHNRQLVLLSMAYNMGVTGLLGFEEMFTALAEHDYDRAAYEMLNSKWHRDFMRWARGDLGKTRSYRLSEIMRTGVMTETF
jgi:lysozyme